MHGTRSYALRIRARILCGFAAPALLAVGGWAHADEKVLVLPENEAPMAPAAKAARPLNLEACRQIALEKAPTVAAARASLDAAYARSRAVEKLHFASLISRDIPIRRKQACLGITISQAAVTQAEWDTLHGVTYCYLTALYATRQLAVADRALKRLKTLDEIVADAAKNDKTRETRDLPKIRAYQAIAEARRAEAENGVQRALSALREAMGLCEHDELEIEFGVVAPSEPPSKEEIVAAALARRGEMVQAGNASIVTCLEVQAQRRQSVFLLKAPTFASSSDIHAREVPQSFHDESYRPGAIALEMPAFLPGKRPDRIEQAKSYHDRAEAVVAKTKNLIALEAEQAYLRYQEAKTKAAKLAPAAANLREVFKQRWRLRPTVIAGNIDQVLTDGVLTTDTQVQANLAEYQSWIGAANIERATAGGYCPTWQISADAAAEDDEDE